MICQDAPRARCYLEVNTAAIANNLAAARELLKPETRLIAVLKADAYMATACVWLDVSFGHKVCGTLL